MAVSYSLENSPMNPQKLSVLHQLQQEKAPISLPDLMLKMGPTYAERSVRRWLIELIQSGDVSKQGNKRATKYFADILSNSTSSHSCFSPQSLEVVRRVQLPIYERNPTAYSNAWFESYEPNKTFYIPASLRTKLREAGIRSSQHEPAGTYAHQIYTRLLIDLSYNSSRLEGNTYSLLDTQRLVIEGTSASGKLDEEKIMILNHKEAIRYLVDKASRLEVSEETICTLHYLLSDGLIESRFAGKVRDHGVRIGGSTYIPIEDTKKLKNQLQRIASKAALINDPYEKSLFLLVHISYLQAFTDVNKRTARLSANIPLIANNLVPLSFNDISKEDYINALIAIYELQELQPIIDLYSYSYLRTCISYDSTIQAMGFDEVRVRYRTERRELLRQIILDKLVGDVLENFILTKTNEIAVENDRESFLIDLREDLEQMDKSRITGLGVTLNQLNEWLVLFHD